MKKLFLFLLFACVLTGASAQTKIDLNEAAKHVGDSVTVEGKIYGVKTFDKPGSPVLLNLGADFPNQALTVAVFPSYQSGSVVMPVEGNTGNVARVTGKIEIYKGKPQIAVRTTNQMTIVSLGAVSPAKQ